MSYNKRPVINKSESVAEFLKRGGKITVGPKPKIPTQYTKARNANLNGLWNGVSSTRKGF